MCTTGNQEVCLNIYPDHIFKKPECFIYLFSLIDNYRRRNLHPLVLCLVHREALDISSFRYLSKKGTLSIMKCTEIIIIGFTYGSYKCKWVKGTFFIFQLGRREGGEKSKSSESHWWFQEQLRKLEFVFL